MYTKVKDTEVSKKFGTQTHADRIENRLKVDKDFGTQTYTSKVENRLKVNKNFYLKIKLEAG